MHSNDEFIEEIKTLLKSPYCNCITKESAKKLLTLLLLARKSLKEIDKYVFSEGDFPLWKDRSEDNQESLLRNLIGAGL